MIVPEKHPDLTVGGTIHDLSHLNAYNDVFVGKVRVPGTDLHALVKFSCHVFTERTKFGAPFDLNDHYGTKRSFDQKRYGFSRRLPHLLHQAIIKDALCSEF